jgi:hypothetical protein
MKHVDSEIDKTGSWKMIQHNIQSSTINESEFFNCVISDLQEWVGRPVDAIIISLERLSHYVDVEILRSRYGLGKLRWKITRFFLLQIVNNFIFRSMVNGP